MTKQFLLSILSKVSLISHSYAYKPHARLYGHCMVFPSKIDPTRVVFLFINKLHQSGDHVCMGAIARGTGPARWKCCMPGFPALTELHPPFSRSNPALSEPATERAPTTTSERRLTGIPTPPPLTYKGLQPH